MIPSDPSPATPPQENPPSLPPAPPRAGQRSELTRQVLEVHYAGEIQAQKQAALRGAHWFYWVAALSLINTIINIFHGGVSFLAGLAVFQIIDGLAAGLGNTGPYLAIALELVIVVFVCGFGYLASQGSKTALIIGMILYALDGAVFVLFGDYFPALFHGFVLYQIWMGWTAQVKLDQMKAAVAEDEAAGGQPGRRGPIT